LVFTPALILAFSPGEKERRLCASVLRKIVRPIQPLEISKTREHESPLLGEKAGMREVYLSVKNFSTRF
jgi:hypothetical protein